jgi:(p)ppGpp synthase/HD superfamily hydrolase
MQARGVTFELTRANLPTFAAKLPVTRRAIRFASRVHQGQRRVSDEAPFILHPLEVAASLYAAGCPDRVVAAGVLHDVIEDTGAVLEEIRRRFGAYIAGLVSSLTEDKRITDSVARKAALRAQVHTAGAESAIVFAADKLSKARELRIQLSHVRLAGETPPVELEHRLEHYIASLEMLEGVIPDQPIVRQLRFELEALQTLPPGVPAVSAC